MEGLLGVLAERHLACALTKILENLIEHMRVVQIELAIVL